ncbi:pyridoxamine 5'-phosphate oxidase family protein [Agarivorans sp. MS3-6]|uniref:pyridoxamine 5'-phosphate oxidase family protein n=1 Tax=Agarivorans sp. TSD2052 TaxID=2937286 RepID=UPI002010003D|nr:pyridoxamine 5'-phosphate oxidase family protein [Agarivorans sp. TSD2052]UPW17700.1 pyridoxamine 5'-phosphate oxidase family protein [Agarivorans sp. TSD2052]
MIDKKQRLASRLGPEIAEFIASQQSILIASIGEDGFPHSSYSPFVSYQGAFYILISDISKHADYLRAHEKAAVMLIADEVDTKQIYARKRLSYDVIAKQVDSEPREQVLDLLEQRHGEIVGNLRQLADFSLFALSPVKGRYVKGFGQAFDIQGLDDVDFVHLKEGHKKRA